MKARVVMALGLAALAAILAVVLSQKAQRRSGTDLTPNGSFVASLGTGQEACQGRELLPADTSAIRVTIGTYGKPGPRVGVRFTGPHGEVVSAGGLPAGWREGVVQIPIAHRATAMENVSVCLRNFGPGQIAIAGANPDPGYVATFAGQSVEARLRYDYMRPGRESWAELLPTIVYRSTLAKAGLIRHWAWVGALVLMLLAIGLAARTIVREDAP